MISAYIGSFFVLFPASVCVCACVLDIPLHAEIKNVMKYENCVII